MTYLNCRLYVFFKCQPTQFIAKEKVPIRNLESRGFMGSETLLGGKRCLVLDDEFLIALDIQHILEAAVISVASAAEAVSALHGDKAFDVAVLDLKLGGAGGNSVRVAELLNARGTPFVFLTGIDSGDRLLSKFPHVPVVEKPYRVPLLLEALARALGSS
jgi:CheY-like chemotaxis protein